MPASSTLDGRLVALGVIKMEVFSAEKGQMVAACTSHIRKLTKVIYRTDSTCSCLVKATTVFAPHQHLWPHCRDGCGDVCPLRVLRKCELVVYCILVQGSLLIDARGSEKGAMVNASGGRLAQEKSLLQNNATVPQCHSLPVPITKSTLKPTFYSLIHPSEPDALSLYWGFQ